MLSLYTVFLFQIAYPEQIEICKIKSNEGIYVECLLLNEDKTPHMTLFSGGPFNNDGEIDDMVKKILACQLSRN